jgi:sugar/nucleoside kinase (ribokinase family)
MITALVQPVVDVIVSCPDEFLARFGWTPGSYDILEKEEQLALLHSISSFPSSTSLGGNATNSIVTARHLGVPCALIGFAGADALGHQMRELLQKRDITMPLDLIPGAHTGSCISLVTAHGERTMRTHLGVSKELDAHHLHISTIESSTWLLLEGYFLTASQENARALHSAVAVARKRGTKVALSASATFVIAAKRSEILDTLLGQCDLLFANAQEAMLLTNEDCPRKALTRLKDMVPSAIVTAGSAGAYGTMNGITWHTPAQVPPGPIVDTTGAGDTFAGAFMAGIVQGLSPQEAAAGAATLAALIVSQPGAQLPADTPTPW